MKHILTLVGALLLVIALAWAQADEGYYGGLPDDQQSYKEKKAEAFSGLAPGIGREDTHYAFSGCRKVDWIKKQRLTETQWDMAVDKLALDCGMDPLEPEEKEVIVEYLTRYYGRFRH
jgi:hypothetical protein